jgi:hypothetical protein
MKYCLLALGLGFAALAAPAASSGDDLTGQQRVLCSAVHVTLCTTDGDCKSELPWNLNIPQFIEIDFKGKMLSTTKASGENRSTPIRTIERDGGLIFVQGIEQGRAFSFVISEATGMASIAIAREDRTVTVFGACTSLPEAK